MGREECIYRMLLRLFVAAVISEYYVVLLICTAIVSSVSIKEEKKDPFQNIEGIHGIQVLFLGNGFQA